MRSTRSLCAQHSHRSGLVIDSTHHLALLPYSVFGPRRGDNKRDQSERRRRPHHRKTPCPRSRTSTSSPASGAAQFDPDPAYSRIDPWCGHRQPANAARPGHPHRGGPSPLTGGRSSSSSTSPRLLASWAAETPAGAGVPPLAEAPDNPKAWQRQVASTIGPL